MSITRRRLYDWSRQKHESFSISSTTLNKPIKKIAEAGKDFEELCYTLLWKSCWTDQRAFKVVWGRGISLPITEKLKLYTVREAFHIDELRKGDKVEEFRFEI